MINAGSNLATVGILFQMFTACVSCSAYFHLNTVVVVHENDLEKQVKRCCLENGTVG